MKLNKLIDLKLIVSLLGILIFSLLSLYSALHTQGEFSGRNIFVRQIIWLGLGGVVLGIFYLLDYYILYELSIPLYLLSLLFLIAVEVLGRIRMGAQRWIEIFGVTFQPSELAKLAAVLLLARFFSGYLKIPYHNRRHDFWEGVVKPFLPLGILAFFIFTQPDLGTTLVIVFLFIFMVFTLSRSRKNALIIISFIILLMPLGWKLLKPYQKQRLMVFLNPYQDPLGAGYTMIQSKIAVGSGRLWGKGFLAGTQNQLNFIPARHTDFIFTVVAEEWGFAGCLLLLFLYYVFLRRILAIAFMTKDEFGCAVSLGIFALFLFHIFVNIAMVLGVLPVVGIPLPFLSYGGSFTLVSFSLLGIALNVYRKSNYF